MNRFLLLLIVSISLLSCSKKDTSSASCEFVGKWCQPNPATNDCLVGTELEFRQNGELIQSGTSFFTWKSSDCKKIEVIHTATGMKIAEYNVISISGNNMNIDIGAGPTYMIRVP